MADINHIWNTIVHSNTFNFVVFVAILIYVAKKINIGAAITALQEKIIKIIEDAKKEKNEAIALLSQAQKEVENLPSVLDSMLQDAQKSAAVISEKLLSQAKAQMENIETNAQKVIEAEEKMLADKLRKSTSLHSINSAKEHVENVLKQTPSLHEKYINDSIDEIDRLIF